MAHFVAALNTSDIIFIKLTAMTALAIILKLFTHPEANHAKFKRTENR
jgi:hypothetical protein